VACKCCSPAAYRELFDEKQARKDARRYRRKGLDKAARRIVSFLARGGIAGHSVLEVGGGIGAIELELLKSGAAHATNVELSPAYDSVAHELLAEARVEDRVERRTGDVVEIADQLEHVDDVVLHRVVCCYPDVDALVGAAAQRSRLRLVITYPPDNAIARAINAGSNLYMRFRGSEFRSFVWPVAAIARAAEAQGFTRVAEERASLVWRMSAFERRASASGESFGAGPR
jgi:hypothetical protein